jgi:hypothetical protein
MGSLVLAHHMFILQKAMVIEENQKYGYSMMSARLDSWLSGFYQWFKFFKNG